MVTSLHGAVKTFFTPHATLAAVTPLTRTWQVRPFSRRELGMFRVLNKPADRILSIAHIGTYHPPMGQSPS